MPHSYKQVLSSNGLAPESLAKGRQYDSSHITFFYVLLRTLRISLASSKTFQN